MNPLSEEEQVELKRLVTELYAYADHIIGREIDADDLKSAVDHAASTKDLDLLRVYDKCVYSLSFDIFITDNHVRMLRKNGYVTVAGFYDEKTEDIAHGITAALVDEKYYGAISLVNRERLCAYAMANPHLAPLIMSFIKDRHVTQYDEVMELVEQGQNASALANGAL